VELARCSQMRRHFDFFPVRFALGESRVAIVSNAAATHRARWSDSASCCFKSFRLRGYLPRSA